MEPRYISILVAFFVSAWVAVHVPPCTAQGASVEQPKVEAGDTWKYRRTVNGRAGVRHMRVASASEKLIQVVATGPDGKEADETYTAEWNPVATVNAIYYPNLGIFKFPLQVGASYPIQFEMVIAAMPSARVLHSHTVKVMGWEEVQVPAGKYRALMVESQGTWQRLDLKLEGTSRIVAWYVPEMRRWVRFTYEENSRIASELKPGIRLTDELVEFTPAGLAQTKADDDICAGVKNFAVDDRMAACTRLITAGGSNPIRLAGAYYYRGVMWSGKGDRDRAIADYSESIRYQPQMIPVHLNRGDEWMAKGEADRAIADYTEVISLNPKVGDAYRKRAVAWEKKGDKARAAADLDEANRLKPR